MSQKLQNSKCYAGSPEFLPALGLFISRRSLSLQLEVNYIPGSLDLKKHCTHTHIYNIYGTAIILVSPSVLVVVLMSECVCFLMSVQLMHYLLSCKQSC